MQFCGNNETLAEPWVNHGLNVCFSATLRSALNLSLAIFFGIAHLVYHYRYGTLRTRGKANSIRSQFKRLNGYFPGSRPWNKLFRLQIICHVLIGVFPFLKWMLTKMIRPDGDGIDGFEILDMISSALFWPMCLILIFVERRYLFHDRRIAHHGKLLLTMWTIAFLAENLQFLTFNNQVFTSDLSR